jgi:hypothetical protein
MTFWYSGFKFVRCTLFYILMMVIDGGWGVLDLDEHV